MIQILPFHGSSNKHPQLACNQAATNANIFLDRFQMEKEQVVNTAISYTTTLVDDGKAFYHECTIILTIVTDTRIFLDRVQTQEQDEP